MPKVFISYSWTSQDYQSDIVDIADRLIKNGIEVVIDEYDLREGHDVIYFMESLSQDTSIDFVLVFSDASYATKANSREKGVGKEAQIISKSVYESVTQERVIPIVMARNEDGQPCLPEFMSGRKYFDFSSPEQYQINWERLIRLLHGKPLRSKPTLGAIPEFSESNPSSYFLDTKTKFTVFRIAMLEGRRSLPVLRADLISTYLREWVQTFKEVPEENDPLSRWESWLRINTDGRNTLIDWFLLETQMDAAAAATEAMIPVIESMCEYLTQDGQLNDGVLRAAADFLLDELALYCVACSMASHVTPALLALLTTPIVKSSRSGNIVLGIHCVSEPSNLPEIWSQKQEARWLSPSAAYMKQRADHGKINSLILWRLIA